MRRLVLLCVLPLLLNGCAGAIVSTGAQAGIAVAENRSLGRKLDDTVIYTDLANQFIQADKADLLGKVTFNVRYARVMLTGNVKSEEDAQKAVELAWKAKGVTEVINELNVSPGKTIVDTANDALIKRNLEARLLITKGVWVINYSIDVTNGTAYLIGRVKDKAELDRALNIARTTKGVKRVISHLQINADTAHTVAAPDGSGGVEGTSSIDANDAPAPTRANGFTPYNDSGAGSDIYTGPVYGGGSISSTPLDAPKATAPAPSVTKPAGKPFGSGPSVPAPAATDDVPSSGY